MKTTRLLVFITCCWLSSAAVSAQALHPRLRSGELRVRRVLLLPPGLAVVQQGIAKSALLDQPTAELTVRLTVALQTALAAKGFTVLPDPFGLTALQQDPQLQFELADLQARYDLQAPAMHQDKRALERGEFTLGKEVAHLQPNLSPNEQADALVIVRGYGTDPTLAKTAYALLVPFGGTPNATLYLSIALLDARTGDVLWLTRQTISGNFRHAQKAEPLLAKALAKALKPLPMEK
jgi:hypothetical protein